MKIKIEEKCPENNQHSGEVRIFKSKDKTGNVNEESYEKSLMKGTEEKLTTVKQDENCVVGVILVRKKVQHNESKSYVTLRQFVETLDLTKPESIQGSSHKKGSMTREDISEIRKLFNTDKM